MMMHVKAGMFDRLIILFNVACTKNGLDQTETKAFIDILESKKQFMVTTEQEKEQDVHSLMDND